MFVLAAIIAILISILLIFIVLIQNPKGGVLSSTFGSMGNQILGANRSTDVIEKITWYLAGGLMVLSILSIFILPPAADANGTQQTSEVEEALKNNTSTPAPVLPTAPQSTPPAQQQNAPTGQEAAPTQQQSAPAQKQAAPQAPQPTPPAPIPGTK